MISTVEKISVDKLMRRWLNTGGNLAASYGGKGGGSAAVYLRRQKYFSAIFLLLRVLH